MSKKHLLRLNLGLAGAAVTFAALAIVLSFAGAEEQPQVAPAPTTVAPGPSDEEVAAFYEAVQAQAFYEALSTTTTVPATTVPPAPPVTAPPVTAPPSPPVVDTPSVIEYASGSIEDMICATFGDQCQKALSVVYCESRFNPGTVGAAGERGLFQIHPVHIPYLSDRGLSWDAMFDPASNIAYAYDLYSRSGWGPWTCA